MFNGNHKLLILATILTLLLSGCTVTSAPIEIAVTNVATVAATSIATVDAVTATTLSFTASPTVLPSATADPPTTANCPPTPAIHRNDVLGVELAYSDAYEVVLPRATGDDYGFYLMAVGRIAEQPTVLQVLWRHANEMSLEERVDEMLSQLADLPVARAPVTVAGVEGVMLSPVPGEVANTAIYLPVGDRVYYILYGREALDDAGRCLLAGLSFYAPALTLEELTLTPAADALAVSPAATPPADWATYHDPEYGYSFRYPAGRWTPIFPADNAHLLSLVYQEGAIALRIMVSRPEEGVDMQLYGGAAGDMLLQGAVTFIGEPVERTALVQPGLIHWIYYNATNPIPRGDLLFSLALVSSRSPARGLPAVVPEPVQAEADRILSTFALDSAPMSSAAPESEPVDCATAELSDSTPVDFVSAGCVVWRDAFDDETGFRVHLAYEPSGERFVYEVGPNVEYFAVPEPDRPRLADSPEQCRQRNAFTVEVVALRPDGEWRVGSMAANVECGEG